jgi:hypothetical protein
MQITKKIGQPKTILHLSVMPAFELNPFLKIIENHKLPAINRAKTQDQFAKNILNIYLPVFSFLSKNKIKTNVVITGEFYDFMIQDHFWVKEFYNFIESTNSLIYADAYYGNNVQIAYHQDWFIQSLEKTIQLLKTDNQLKINGIYLSQIYRSFPLEKILWKTKIQNFITVTNSKKDLYIETSLKEIRTIKEKLPFWLEEKEDIFVNLQYIFQKNHFNINVNMFQPDLDQSIKTFALAVAYKTEKSIINLLKKKSNKIQVQNFQMNENPTYFGYNNLQRAVIRLWTSTSQILWSEFEYNSHNKRDNDFIKAEYSRLQNFEFLNYLIPVLYRYEKITNFNSPYEAFVNMQTACKMINIKYYNKI